MPNIAELVDHQAVYDELIENGVAPVIINDLPSATEDDRKRIKELTITQLSSDTISLVPTCGVSCNKTRGRYAIGTTCPHCGNVVESTVADNAKSVLWLRAPKGVNTMMTPVMTRMLSSYFTKAGYDAIAWLTDSGYSPVSRVPLEIEKLARRNHGRDLNYFSENFDQILADLMDIFPEKSNRPYNELHRFIQENRHKIFSRYLPLPSKNLFVVNKTVLGVYMELSIQDSLDIIYHFVSIDRDFYDRSPKVIMNRTARCLYRQSLFYDSYIRTNMQPKPAHMRRHLYGSRNVFSGRAVIISMTDPHRYDTVGIPWRMAVPMFQHDLSGILQREGMTHNEALGHIMRHVCVYDERICRHLKDIFSQASTSKRSKYGLTEETESRGPAFLLHRNPTLGPGSMQRFFGILKEDPRDPCISMSILTVTSPNADFDGDALGLLYSRDKKMADFWDIYSPEYNTFELNTPGEVSSNIALTKPVVMSGGAWMDDPDEQ